jgi:hypothetical protein
MTAGPLDKAESTRSNWPRRIRRLPAEEAIAVPAHDGVGADRRLRDLHDVYVWEVNAAVGEGREDLVQRLVDEYFDAAIQMMNELYGDACDRPDCAICAQPAAPNRPVPRRRRWWRLLHRRPVR